MSIRTKILKKISQANPPKSENIGDPPDVSVSLFPTLVLGWGSNNTAHIQKILDVINISIHILSNAKTDLDKMRQQSFATDVSSYHATVRDLLLLSKEIYQNILTNDGDQYKLALTPEIKASIINNIKNSTQFRNIPDGPLASTLAPKIGGNLKSILSSTFSNIK